MSNDIGQNEILVGAVSGDPRRFGEFETSILMGKGKLASWWSFTLGPEHLDNIKKHPYLYLYFRSSGERIYYRYHIEAFTEKSEPQGQLCPSGWRSFIRDPENESGTTLSGYTQNQYKFKVWFLVDDLEEVPNGISRGRFLDHGGTRDGQSARAGRNTFKIWKIRPAYSEEFQFHSMLTGSQGRYAKGSVLRNVWLAALILFLLFLSGLVVASC